uniref:C-type lectin domain-containing protein n=1 Tax=Labrus bergylta TaxID=56723 RepID=A0A3Q3FNH7_9LABR
MLNSVPPVDKIVILMSLLISSCILTGIIMFNSQIFSLAYSPGFCTPILYARREFHYIDLKMNWADAQQYCREKYIDLATIESKVDNNRLKGIEPSEAWIGLHDDPLSWKGIGGNERNSWRCLYGQQNCVVMNSDTSLDEEDCNREFYVILLFSRPSIKQLL